MRPQLLMVLNLEIETKFNGRIVFCQLIRSAKLFDKKNDLLSTFLYFDKSSKQIINKIT